MHWYLALSLVITSIAWKAARKYTCCDSYTSSSYPGPPAHCKGPSHAPPVPACLCFQGS